LDEDFNSDSELDRGLDHDVKRFVALMRRIDLTSDVEDALARRSSSYRKRYGIGEHSIERRRYVAAHSIGLSISYSRFSLGPGLEDREDSFGDQQDNARLRSYVH
jgi:hypothetical protein